MQESVCATSLYADERGLSLNTRDLVVIIGEE